MKKKKLRIPLAILIILLSTIGSSLFASEGIHGLKAIEIVQLLALGFVAGVLVTTLKAYLSTPKEQQVD